jgi:tRNA threonylcarbamoyladenosine biosynthesis protein TsaE
MEWIFTLDDIGEIARDFWKFVGVKRVIGFSGSMGAGKTTFIKALCAELDIKDVIGSPTFPIINEYAGNIGKIYHMDLFRLSGPDEALQAGVEDCLFSGFTCLVEWPEIAPSIFPDDTVYVQMDVINEQTRCIRIRDN